VATFGKVARAEGEGRREGLDMAGMVCAWPWLGLPRVLLRSTMLVLVREGTRGPIGVGWGRLVRVESLFAIVANSARFWNLQNCPNLK
jgi:hypothetical protein